MLTDKKRRFAEAKHAGLSNRDAAVAAGYSVATAPNSGARLAKDSDVLQEVARLAAGGKKGATEKVAKKPAKPRTVKPKAQPLTKQSAAKSKAKALTEEKPEAPLAVESRPLPDFGALYSDPMDYLRALMNDPNEDSRVRADAAKAIMPYMHRKLGEATKKEGAASRARKASTGSFAPRQPPQLKVVGK